MRLTEIQIEHFRCFAEARICLSPYTCFVGPNGSGKSTVLTALNVFFRNTATSTDVHTLDREDFHHQDVSKPIRISLTFEDLSQEAQEVFKHYYRQGRLTVFAKAVWDENTKSAPVKQYGCRLVMKEFAPYFEAEQKGEKVPELRIIYERIRGARAELPEASTKVAMTAGLRDYEEAHPELCEIVEDIEQFYGWTKGVNRLAPYIQWVYVPAVKDASAEQDESSKTALGQLLQRTIRAKVSFDEELAGLREVVESKYQEIVEGHKESLQELQQSIEQRLKDWADPNARLLINWHCEPGRTFSVNEPLARASIGDETFIGEVARLGHGMQRGFLVSLLQELALSGQERAPRLILGFEEPELYQHPPQAQHLASMMERMCETSDSNTQAIVTTHCPYFVSGKGFEAVRMVRKQISTGESLINGSSLQRLEERIARARGEKPRPPSTLMASIQQIMQPSQNELFFSTVAVLVEGLEDVALISTHMQLAGNWAGFRKVGCHFVIAGGKKNLSRLIGIALELEIPHFVVFDSDAHVVPSRREQHKVDNLCVLNLCSVPNPDPLPRETLWRDNLVMWDSDIGVAVRRDIGEDVWNAAQVEAKQKHQFDIKGGKNMLLIAATLEILWSRSARSRVLEKLCDSILRCAATVRDKH